MLVLTVDILFCNLNFLLLSILGTTIPPILRGYYNCCWSWMQDIKDVPRFRFVRTAKHVLDPGWILLRRNNDCKWWPNSIAFEIRRTLPRGCNNSWDMPRLSPLRVVFATVFSRDGGGRDTHGVGTPGTARRRRHHCDCGGIQLLHVVVVDRSGPSPLLFGTLIGWDKICSVDALSTNTTHS